MIHELKLTCHPWWWMINKGENVTSSWGGAEQSTPVPTSGCPRPPQSFEVKTQVWGWKERDVITTAKTRCPSLFEMAPEVKHRDTSVLSSQRCGAVFVILAGLYKLNSSPGPSEKRKYSNLYSVCIWFSWKLIQFSCSIINEAPVESTHAAERQMACSRSPHVCTEEVDV